MSLLPFPLHAIHHRQKLTSVHPQLMIEGAFSHVPFDGTSYGYRTKSGRYTIPDQNGENNGQSTWVDLAACCAATPSADSTSRPFDVDAKGDAFAPPLASRCLSYTEQQRGLTYLKDVEPKGIPKSPCAAQNLGFYHDLTRDDYHPRHSACCSWFKTFLNDAWSEYPDLMSKNIIDRVNNDEDSLTLYDKARHLVEHYDEWSTTKCLKGRVKTDSSCCVACMSTNIPNKLNKYTLPLINDDNQNKPDGPSNNLCSYFGDGWCGINQGTTIGEVHKEEHGLDMMQSNPSIMVDGAFKHRPTHGNLHGGEPGKFMSLYIISLAYIFEISLISHFLYF
jgi:hypothetical protein